MVAGFHYNITATGGVEGRYRKKVGEEQVCISQLESQITIWASLFSEENMEQQWRHPQTRSCWSYQAQELLGMWCELASLQQLYAIGATIRILQMRKLRCIGIKKHA